MAIRKTSTDTRTTSSELTGLILASRGEKNSFSPQSVQVGLVFGVATFPWFSLMMTALYFPASSFRRLPLIPSKLAPCEAVEETADRGTRRTMLVVLLAVYVTIQLGLPLRHFLYPGDVNWNEDGQDFAWRMMLRDKACLISYDVRDPESGRTWREAPRKYLTPWQLQSMSGNPDMILQFAHFLAEKHEKEGHPGVEVRALAKVSLNGRPFRPLVDPEINLAQQERSLLSYPWVLP